MRTLHVVSLLALSLAFASCAHHRDVRPGADGVNKVVVRAPEKTDAERSAVAQAEDFCEQTKKMPAVISENTKYTGTMDESTRDTVKKASTAARILGGGSVYGSEHTTSKNSSTLGKAGTVGSIMTSGDDYVTEMTFKCQ